MALVAYEAVVVDDVGSSLSKEIRHGQGHNARSIHNLSSSSLRKKSCTRSLFSKVHSRVIRNLLTNMQEVLLGTKLFVLFPAVPLAIAAQCWGFGQTWVFALSLLGLTPLAERLSFLTEQISFYTGPTVGGLLNATCGNATELIVALFALHMGKIEVVKHSLVGSVLSNLLLVLGTSLLCGGLENLSMEQHFDHKQADMNTALLLLGGLCHVLTLMLRSAVNSGEYSYSTVPTLVLSRASSIVMLVTYIAYLLFQLKTHRQLYEPEEEDDNDDVVAEAEVLIGFPSALVWLVCVTILIAVLSEYAVSTIEAASESWGMPINFVSIILLPIIGNAAEHAGAIIFSLKNKLDITLGITLGSATQISMFVVPLSVIVAWIMGIPMDLDFKLLETISLVGSILITSIILRDGTSHYLKGFTLILVYIVIAACCFST